MSHDDLQPPQADDAALDALLAQARWPEPTAQSAARLRQLYLTLPRHDHRHRLWPSLIAAAAVLLVAAGVWLAMRPFESSPRSPVAHHSDVMLTSRTVVLPTMSRAPTPLEISMLRHWTPAKKVLPSTRSVPSPAARVVTPPPSPPKDPLDALVEAGPARSSRAVFDLLADPVNSQAVSAALCRRSSLWIDALFAALDDPREGVRLAAAGVLARIDGPVVTARLATMTRGRSGREAVIALVQIPTPDARQFVRAAENSRDLAGVVRSVIVQYAPPNGKPQEGVTP